MADLNRLRDFAERILIAASMDPEDARLTAELLLFANLRGVDSHGVYLLETYADILQNGAINPRPQVRVVERRGATALVDADQGMGFRPTVVAIDLAVEIARSSGIGAVGVRHSHQFGMAASYTIRAANAGVIGILTTNTIALIAPPGGTRAAVGNNPISCAVPRPSPHRPICLDMAVSEAAYGRIGLAAKQGGQIPAGWAYDAKGQPTTDAAAAWAAGMLAPIGRHKGYGLSVISEVLAGVLTGSPFGTESSALGRRNSSVGHFAIAIDPTFFVEETQFHASVERLVAMIKDVPLAEGASAVYMPGEPEWNTLEIRQRDGIPISDELAQRLAALAERLSVDAAVWR